MQLLHIYLISFAARGNTILFSSPPLPKCMGAALKAKGVLRWGSREPQRLAGGEAVQDGNDLCGDEHHHDVSLLKGSSCFRKCLACFAHLVGKPCRQWVGRPTCRP